MSVKLISNLSDIEHTSLLRLIIENLCLRLLNVPLVKLQSVINKIKQLQCNGLTSNLQRI